MSNIIFSWEIGSNSGHISEILPVAKSLKNRGHTVNLLFREIHGINLSDLDNIPVFQAPVWLANVSGLAESPISFAEILLRCGYHDENYLIKIIDVWCNTLKLFNPDLLIANYSPTAILAAKILNLPVVTIGTGFYTPPQLNPLPSIRPWLQNNNQRLLESDNRITKTINSVLSAYGTKPIESLADLFKVTKNFFFTYPELDHYRNRVVSNLNEYVGPIFDMSRGSEVSWPNDSNVKVFVYLRPDFRDCELVIRALHLLDYAVIAVIPGLSQFAKENLQGKNLNVYTESIQLSSIVDTCDLAIGYGGNGFTSAMLLSNIPQLIFPTNLEQFLLAQRIEELGACVVVNTEGHTPNYCDLIKQVITKKSLKRSCIEYSKSHSKYNQDYQLNKITDYVESSF
ncbi:MAG: nucleotide disphospho-sugar-binding domain-containing protein [Betaproteobacteria bacterium]